MNHSTDVEKVQATILSYPFSFSCLVLSPRTRGLDLRSSIRRYQPRGARHWCTQIFGSFGCFGVGAAGRSATVCHDQGIFLFGEELRKLLLVRRVVDRARNVPLLVGDGAVDVDHRDILLLDRAVKLLHAEVWVFASGGDGRSEDGDSDGRE